VRAVSTNVAPPRLLFGLPLDAGVDASKNPPCWTDATKIREEPYFATKPDRQQAISRDTPAMHAESYEPFGIAHPASSSDMIKRAKKVIEVGTSPRARLECPAGDAYLKPGLGEPLVQIYTALIYNGSSIVKQICHGLVDLLKRDGFGHVSQAVASAHGKSIFFTPNKNFRNRSTRMFHPAKYPHAWVVHRHARTISKAVYTLCRNERIMRLA